MQRDEGRWGEIISAGLEAVRSARPLVHHITSEVTAEASANTVLALGGLATMAYDPGEVEGAVDQADAVVLNLGTLTSERMAAMERAHRVALRLGRPIVLDPVGAGSLRGRDRAARRLLRGASWMVVRMNAAELRGVMDVPVRGGRGVDADPDPADEARPGPAEAVPAGASREEIASRLEPVVELASNCALRHEVVVAVTGEIDVVTDGERVVYLRSGHPWLTRITGAGCMASSAVGAALGAMHERARLDSLLESAVAGLAFLEAAAVWATEGGESAELGPGGHPSGPGPGGPPPGPGTWRVRLFDGLYHLDAARLLWRIECWEVGA